MNPPTVRRAAIARALPAPEAAPIVLLAGSVAFVGEDGDSERIIAALRTAHTERAAAKFDALCS